MIETRRLKNVIFVQTILSFVLSRKIINIYNDIARKYGNVTIIIIIFEIIIIKLLILPLLLTTMIK